MIIDIPDFISKTKSNDVRTLDIDDEIVDAIKYLWEHEIITLGCCSGHGKESPSVIIDSSYNDICFFVKHLLTEIDPNRKWKVLQWKLIEI